MTMNYNYSFIVTKLNSFSEFHISLCFGAATFLKCDFSFLWASCLLI